MRQLFGVLVALLLCGAWGSPARAQIESHDFKLTLEAGLVSFAKNTATYEGEFGGEIDFKTKVTSVGLLGSGYLAAGFAVNRFIIPTLAFGLQHQKAEDDDGTFATTGRTWELRPGLEVALLPSLRFVPFVAAGLSLARRILKQEEEDEGETFTAESKAFGVGPAITVGVHGFVVQKASLDLSLTYRGLFFGKTEVSDSEFDDEDAETKQTEHAILLNLGASFWI